MLLCPWITIGIFLLSWWSIVPSCTILELSVQSVSCLQRILSRFPTMWQYDLDLWLTTLKNNRHLPINADPLNRVLDLGTNGSVCILHTMYPVRLSRFTMWQYDIDLCSPTLKNKRVLPLIMLMNCTKLYDPGTLGSFRILLTTFFYNVTVRPWPLITDFERNRHLPLIMLINCT